MYTYLLIMALYGTQYPLEYQQMLSSEQCNYYGAIMSKVSPAKKDYYYICAPLEVSGMGSDGKPVYALGEGIVYGGGKVPKSYKNVKYLNDELLDEIVNGPTKQKLLSSPHFFLT